eukprot:g2567.t1
MVEMSREGFYLPSYRMVNFRRVSYLAVPDYGRMALAIIVLLLFVKYMVDECHQMRERWEDPVEDGSPHWDKSEREEKARQALKKKIVGNEESSGCRPVLSKVLFGEWANFKEGTCARRCADKMREVFSIIIRPYFYEVFNYFDIVFIACFLALIAMHFVQMVMEMSIDLDVMDDVFVATTFRVAQVHTAQKFLFGWACFFAWLKMFEYLRLTQSFAVMFFIIVGMIEKLMSFLVILLVGLLAFTSVDFLILGNSRARSMTFLDSLISRFSGSLGDVDFESARESEPFWGEFILVLFIIFAVLLLLNLLIAVMSEAYNEIKEVAAARWAYVQMEMLLEERAGKQESGNKLFSKRRRLSATTIKESPAVGGGAQEASTSSKAAARGDDAKGIDASSIELTVANSDVVEESKGDDDETKGGETKSEAPSAPLLSSVNPTMHEV